MLTLPPLPAAAKVQDPPAQVTLPPREAEPTGSKSPTNRESEHPEDTLDEPSLEEPRRARLATPHTLQTASTSVLGKRSRDDQDEPNSKRLKEGAGMNVADLIASQSGYVLSGSSNLGKRKREDDTTASSSKQQKPLPPKCSCCLESDKSKEQYHTADCKHTYCNTCLQKQFRLSMHDETLFPPRCCKTPYKIEQVRNLLGNELTAEFLGKYEELNDTDKIYCHVSTCSTYIATSYKDESAKVGVCPRPECAHKICLTCKGPHHLGKCPDDEGVKLVLGVAKEEGWQRCEPCGRILAHVSPRTATFISFIH